MPLPAPIQDEPGEETEAAVKRLREDEQESSSKRQAVAKGDSDEDDDIIVCSPPKQAQSAIPLESDNPEVTWTNVTNPLVDFPHARKDCGVHQFDESNHELFCPKCCCIVCERPASECTSWLDHCHIISKVKKASSKPKNMRDILPPTIDLTGTDPQSFSQNAAALNRATNRYLDQLRRQDRDYSNRRDKDYQGRGRNKEDKYAGDCTIVEILARNLKAAVLASDGTTEQKIISDSASGSSKAKAVNRTSRPPISRLNMDGDISEIRLQNSFFVGGVKIGWPFPVILPPQRQMAFHIIQGLKRKMHVVLESPTGTGKSAAILCSVLAWQRYLVQRQQTGGESQGPSEVPTIIYCSRTHSQVAQMVASLKKTPYRPRMTVLGSRDRLCINRDVVENKKKVNINSACRSRKRTTDKRRQKIWRDSRVQYDDNNPEMLLLPEENRDAQRPPTCSHYMNLTTERIASDIQSRFVWDTKKISCCSAAGEQSNMGVHDIEDLITFGKNPNQEKITLYRKNGVGSYGIMIKPKPNENGGTEIGPSKKNSAADKDGRLRDGDWIQAVNGEDVGNCNGDQVIQKIKALDKDPLVLDVLRAKGQNGLVRNTEENATISDSTLSYERMHVKVVRDGGVGPFGFQILDRKGRGCEIGEIVEGSAAAKSGQLQKGDWIVGIDGKETQKVCASKAIDEIVVITALKHKALVLDILRAKGTTREDDALTEVQGEERTTPSSDEATAFHEGYSDDSICPYFVSRALQSHANLIFCPYNYVLDPEIRKAMNIDLSGSVVVLDEAHNVEDTLKESGSGDFGEFALYQVMTMLARYSNMRYSSEMELNEGGEKKETNEVAHELLLFIEKLVLHMRELRASFERSPGLEKIKAEHHKYPLSDDHEVEVKYSGPTGYGMKGEAIGCAPFLKELGISSGLLSHLTNYAQSLESHLFNSQSDEDHGILSEVIKVIERLKLASENPEHFFLACVMKVNGNIEYATEMAEDEYTQMLQRKPFKRKPKQIPYMLPRTHEQPDAPLDVCRHMPCRVTDEAGIWIDGKSVVRHCGVCNGAYPRWECHLRLQLLSPGLLMRDIASKCRTVILASGSLAPLPSLCAELNLYGPKKEKVMPPSQSSLDKNIDVLSQNSLSQHTAGNSKDKSPEPTFGRLQISPPPLEANHVVDLPKQLFACSIGHFRDGSPLTVTYSQYKEPSFFPKLGYSIANVVESIPRGGVLLFFPSYNFLNKCVKCWKPGYRRGNYIAPEVWQRMLNAKGKIIVEPTGSQEKFEEARAEYSDKIKQDGNCILFAVFRGKMSEGISFNDDNARCVICIGLPYPSYVDRAIKAKKSYNDEQRKIRGNTKLLPGDEWYSQQAFRAIAQALGRCIRHGADYGAVILMDSRHCDDGSPNGGIAHAHKNLPKWMRHHVRTLSMRPTSGVGSNPVYGGYDGLRSSMKGFFEQAPIRSKEVLDKWTSDFEKARARSSGIDNQTFDSKTGSWTLKAQKEESKKT